MEAALLTFFILSSSAVYSTTVLSTTSIMEWNDVVVAREGTFATLVCIDKTATGAVSVNWMVKTLGTNQWKLVLSANERKEFSGGASKDSMQLTDRNFQDSGIFSLMFKSRREDGGLYTCQVIQQKKAPKERFILLAILTVTVVPAGPVPHHSTLRLIARAQPDLAVNKITWAAPGDISLKTEKCTNFGTVAKLPQVQNSDGGAYVCMVHTRGNSSNPLFAFNVDVTVDADKVASFTNVTHDRTISTAVQAQTSFSLTCPDVLGDYVLLFWRPPDTTTQSNMKLVHQYDRWRSTTLMTEHSKRLQLAGPPYNAQTGNFSFLLTPGIKDGGLYICEVYQNDNAFSQRTILSVVKVKTRQLSTKLELDCRYSEVSQVQSAMWKYQNESHQLNMRRNGPGTITTALPLPVTAGTAGNYTCILQLKNGQTVKATYTITLPSKVGLDESVGVTTPSLLPSLSALLLLVPLVAVAVGALLWRQRHSSDRGIEQSLSVRSGESRNIYENPEDMRQAPPQGPVYMDLKPRGEDDVYKELERYEQCQS